MITDEGLAEIKVKWNALQEQDKLTFEYVPELLEMVEELLDVEAMCAFSVGIRDEKIEGLQERVHVLEEKEKV